MSQNEKTLQGGRVRSTSKGLDLTPPIKGAILELRRNKMERSITQGYTQHTTPFPQVIRRSFQSGPVSCATNKRHPIPVSITRDFHPTYRGGNKQRNGGLVIRGKVLAARVRIRNSLLMTGWNVKQCNLVGATNSLIKTAIT